MTRYDRIKKLVKSKGYTITGLEKQLGFARGSLCKINTSKPSADKLFLLAEALSTTPDYIMSGDTGDQDDTPVDMEVQIQNLITALTGDNSVYYCGESMTDESRLALLNSLKRDMEFLYALHSKKDDE